LRENKTVFLSNAGVNSPKDWHDFYSADWDPETDFDDDTEQRIKKYFPDFNKLEMKKLLYAWEWLEQNEDCQTKPLKKFAGSLQILL